MSAITVGILNYLQRYDSNITAKHYCYKTGKNRYAVGVAIVIPQKHSTSYKTQFFCFILNSDCSIKHDRDLISTVVYRRHWIAETLDEFREIYTKQRGLIRASLKLSDSFISLSLGGKSFIISQDGG